MKYWSLYIFSLLLVVGANSQTDSTYLEDLKRISTENLSDESSVDRVRYFVPQLYLDYGKLLSTAMGLDKRIEGAASILFYEKFEAIVEYGISDLRPEHAYINGNYQSSGTYWRFGGGLMGEINAKSFIGIGVRYGLSNFEDQVVIEIDSPSELQDDFRLSNYRSNLTARWWEAVLTSESRLILNKDKPDSKINNLVRVGFFFRMRFLVTFDNDGDPVDVYSIPGYGSAVNSQQAAMNLFLKFTF